MPRLANLDYRRISFFVLIEKDCPQPEEREAKETKSTKMADFYSLTLFFVSFMDNL